MDKLQNKGLFWAVSAACISGAAVFLNGLVVKGIDPMIHTTIKNTVVGLMVVGTIMLTKDRTALKQISPKNWAKLFTIAVIGGSLAFALFFSGLKLVGAAEGQMLNKTMVVWVALLALPLLKEKVTGRMVLGIGLIYMSSLVGGSWKSTSLTAGHLMVLAATILWAFESILVKLTLKEVSVNLVVGARMAIGSLILWIMLALTGKIPLINKLSVTQWGLLMLVGLVLFGYVMSWYRALKYLPATLVASVLTGAVVVTNILNSLFITKSFNAQNMIQALLIISGAIFVYLAAGRFAPVTGTEVSTNEFNH